MARKSAGSILIVGIALFWVGSGIWESLGWWTLAVPTILFAVALVWTYRTNATDVPEQKEPEQNLQYEIELAASKQRQEEIYRHHKQGGLTDKETLLVWLVFDDWIQLPLPKSYQDKVANADQVFMEFVRQGYFQAADAFTVAEKKLKVAQIKAIFLEHGLPLGGNKAELLERLFMRLPEVAADIVSRHQLYRPTAHGRQIGIYLDEKQRSHAMEGTVAVVRDLYLSELGYLKTHSDTYGLEIIPRSEYCRYGKTLAGIHRKEDLSDDWPPPQATMSGTYLLPISVPTILAVKSRKIFFSPFSKKDEYRQTIWRFETWKNLGSQSE